MTKKKKTPSEKIKEAVRDLEPGGSVEVFGDDGKLIMTVGRPDASWLPDYVDVEELQEENLRLLEEIGKLEEIIKDRDQLIKDLEDDAKYACVCE